MSSPRANMGDCLAEVSLWQPPQRSSGAMLTQSSFWNLVTSPLAAGLEPLYVKGPVLPPPVLVSGLVVVGVLLPEPQPTSSANKGTANHRRNELFIFTNAGCKLVILFTLFTLAVIGSVYKDLLEFVAAAGKTRRNSVDLVAISSIGGLA